MAVSSILRSFKQSVWLGWQMESNWTDPWLFSLYSLVSPIFGMLVVISLVYVGGQAGGKLESSYLAYVLIGSAFFVLVNQTIHTMGWVIHDDREHYEVLKYIYITPTGAYVYILGRAFSTLLIASISTIVTLIFGVAVLRIPVDLFATNIPVLAACLVIGIVAITSLGMILSSITLLTAEHGQMFGETVAGIFFLFCGVVFPASALPSWAQMISAVLPLTYWLSAIRKAVAGASFSSVSIDLLTLLAFTAVFFILSIGVYRLADRLARSKGLIYATTEH